MTAGNGKPSTASKAPEAANGAGVSQGRTARAVAGKLPGDAERGTRTVKSVVRTLAILFELAGSESPLNVAALAGRVGLPRSTVYRLTETLIEEGLVARVRSDLMVTPKLALLTTGARMHITMRQVLERYLHQLVEVSGETASAHVRIGVLRRCIAEIEGTERVRWVRGVGFTAPIWTGAVGHVLLGGLSEDNIHEVLANADIVPTAPASITDRRELVRLALEARQKGWSGSSNETVDGACAIAAPLHDLNGDVTAALSLYAPSSRYSQLLTRVDVLQEIAKEASDQWIRISTLSDSAVAQ
ncbi:MAG: IclR family transcriptional regulator [Actinobacteria bacterium]|jgi:DNA-binding IclR family transcriptional regulator|nr:IclR family transcriptional regulator [Actinomycetota bacterium]MDA8185282.1 IclR family transcriptional regulator [Actinomycetota bacterium]